MGVAIDNFCGAFHHDPMFSAVVVHLQTQAGAWFDNDSFDLKTFAFINTVIPAPWAANLAVCVSNVVPSGFPLGNYVYKVLALEQVDDQHGV